MRSKKPYFFFIKILCGRRSLSLFVKILCVPRSKKALFFFVKILCVPRPLSFFSSKFVRTLRRRAEALPARQSRHADRHITARLFHKEFSVPVIPLCGRDSRRAIIGVFARQKTLCPQHSTEKYRARAKKQRQPPCAYRRLCPAKKTLYPQHSIENTAPGAEKQRQPPCAYRRLCPAENTLSAAQHRKNTAPGAEKKSPPLTSTQTPARGRCGVLSPARAPRQGRPRRRSAGFGKKARQNGVFLRALH